MTRKKKVEKFTKEAAALGFTPINERAAQRYSEYRGRRGKELELWNQWNQSGRKPEHLEPLLTSMNPLITNEARKRMQGLGGSISKPALVQQLRLAAAKGIESYDPKRGVQLTTHVTNNFQRVTDFIAHNRNPKSVPKALVERWGEYNNAINEFSELHGREPNPTELQKRLGWNKSTVNRMRKSFGAEAFTDMGNAFEQDGGEDISQQARTAFLLTKSQMTPEQQAFAELHYPPEGDRQMSVASISKKLGIPQSRVYRIKKMVERKLSPIMRGR
jgi:DNA-directed RNA polymerase specialized sigma subunit